MSINNLITEVLLDLSDGKKPTLKRMAIMSIPFAVPYATKLVTNIYNYDFKNRNKCIINISEYENVQKRGEGTLVVKNNNFDYVCYAINSLTENVKRYDINGSIIQGLESIPQGNFEITYNNTKLRIKTINNECKNIKIIADKKDDVLELIKYGKQIFKKTMSKDIIYTVSGSSYDVTRPVTIKFTKNMKNMFSEYKQKIYDNVKIFLESREKYAGYGIPYKKGILLYGKPGSGKSSFAYMLAREFGLPIYKIMSKISGNNFENSILLFDDVDVYFEINKKRIEKLKKALKNTNTKNEPWLTDYNGRSDLKWLLSFIDGYDNADGCIIIMTTNDISNIDPALLRAGRMDEQYNINNCKSEILNEILHYYFPNQTYDETRIIALSDKFTTAEIINTYILPNINKAVDYVINELEIKQPSELDKLSTTSSEVDIDNTCNFDNNLIHSIMNNIPITNKEITPESIMDESIIQQQSFS
jgi:hypothetical protein